jgi:hypothetical protein
MRDSLHALAGRAWDIHHRAEVEALEHLVRPSMPILFFGDSKRYFGSAVRVLTVGLNPSREEFPRSDPFVRFPGAGLLQYGSLLDLDAYVGSLDGYFRTMPYQRWFDPAFEQLLNGIGTSYYDGRESTALHTDLCTPLATDPTWSGLHSWERAALEGNGRSLWHDLVRLLRPDLVLISVRRTLAEAVVFSLVEDLGVVFEVDGPRRTRPYRLEAARRSITDSAAAVFAFGQASQTPFGSVSGSDKRVMGARLRELIDA